MATRAPTLSVDDREFYPLHEEDDVPEVTHHERQTRYLRDVLSARFPDRLVTGDICIYWERGNRRLYRAPDAFVTAEQPDDPEPRVYLVWRDPPVIFAAEIGSRSTFREDEGPKQEIYERHIQAREYLYADPLRGDLRLWRLGPAGYEIVAPQLNGRLRSEQLDLEFGIDEESYLRVYTPAGERLRTHEEAERDRQAAEWERDQAAARAAAEARQRQEAEARAAVEARQRQEAEARAAAEARQRQEAEARADLERQRREDLERRLAELQAELEQRQAGEEPPQGTEPGSTPDRP